MLTLESNCRFVLLKQKLGGLKRHCNDMGTLMASLVKYADSDNSKDPESNDEELEKGTLEGSIFSKVEQLRINSRNET